MMNQNLKDWIGGIISTIMGAAGPAIMATNIDPATFNIRDGWYNLFSLCFYPSAIALSAYLYKRPLPGMEIDKK